MRNILFALTSLVLSVTASAQEKGRFEVYDFDGFKLHVYYTNDVMGDASFIIEGKQALVTLEEPLFKENAAEFDAYAERLGKNVERRIADYHLGGTSNDTLVMPEGMPAFTKGEVYGGMMKSFAQAFGDAIVPLPTGTVAEVAFGSSPAYAGVSFAFVQGPDNDFPAASILIGGDVFYSHWAPAKAHASHLQVSSAEGIEAQISGLEKALQSGAKLFIGSHGTAAEVDVVEFRIAYFKKMKELLEANKTTEAFIAAMRQAYPELPGEAELEEIGKTLYK